ncbi:MAG TPA: HEAT repeat domain-containing protein [Isosphaeraceae bacterium]|nr:HEAT repeat domain-containing protein [Isosphaeraceae bacterium]
MDGTSSTGRVGGRLILAASLLAIAGWSGCSTFIGTTAASFLKRVRSDPDPNVRFVAYQKLAEPNCYDNEQQKAEAVRTLIEKLDAAEEPVATRAVICRTLGELRDPSAREALIKAVSDPEGVVRIQACRALGKVARPEDTTILARIMTVDNLEDCRIAAIEGLAELKSHYPRVMEVLINGMEHDDPAIRLASVQALRKITGRDLGIAPGPWREYLKSKAQTASAAAPPAPRR